MNRSLFGMNLGAVLLAAFALALPATPALAGPEEDQARARKDLERAREELERARVELQKATRELARSMAEVERDNPKVQYFEYMTNPKRAVLGVLIPDDNETEETRGVRLLAVTPGSGAEKAGLKAGDLVTSLDGKPMAGDGKNTPPKRMREAMRGVKAGDEVKVEYQRDGRSRSTTVVTQAPEPEIAIAPLPMINEWLQGDEFDKVPLAGAPWFMFRGSAIRGLELAKLDEDLGAYFKTTNGVLVVKAPKDSTLGLRSGDVIQKIDGVSVSEPVTVLDKLRSRSEEQSVQLEIVRQGRKLALQASIPVAEVTPAPFAPRAARPARPARPAQPPTAAPTPPAPPANPRDSDEDI